MISVEVTEFKRGIRKMLILVLCTGPVHPESIHRASLVPHFVMLQSYSKMDSAHFSPQISHNDKAKNYIKNI